MNRRRFAILACALVALNVFFWLAASGFALPTSFVQSLFGSRMIRAEVVWQSPDGTVQDTQLYRGVITAVTSTQITLREKDRPADVIPLAANATVRVGIQVETVSQLHKGMRVVVARPANLPADTIQVEGYGG